MSIGRMTAPALWLLSMLLIAPTAATATSPGQAAPAGATRAPAGPGSPAEWQALTRRDVRAFADAARENFIYATYPDPAAWRARFDRTVADVEAKIPLVRDASGYQAVIRYMGVTFNDAHVGAQFTMPPVPAKWPGFLARFDNGRYRVTASRLSSIADGAEVTACDGKPVTDWISTIARYEVNTPVSLENSRMSAALRLLMDKGSPLRPRPSRCTINGRDVALDWQTAPLGELTPVILAWQGNRERDVSTRMIGTDGAWVTLGYFAPKTADQAAAFHAAIAAAPSLRDKRFIVLDVRGNSGGPYDWFMGYLRGLYGPAYADYYATARLHVRGVYRLSRAYVALDDSSAAEDDAFNTPADVTFDVNKAVDDAALKRAKATGAPLFKAAPIPIVRGKAPLNPVRAQVYVLTDYGCASACIAFIDELKRFPGVQQIGLPTYVDSRSGTSVGIDLPSGYATAYLSAMTRDGKVRGDNMPQNPSIRFTGDFRDDAAVEQWVVRDVVNAPGTGAAR